MSEASAHSTAPFTSAITVKRGVIGIISRDAEHLVIQRAPGVVKGGTWCFPGGHLERGENARAAVVRELFEELGYHVRPTRRLGAVRVAGRYVLAVWRVALVGGELCLAKDEVAAVRWLSLDAIRRLEPGLASNAEVLDRLAADEARRPAVDG